jgi:sugar lactone lactonase YvrE
MYYTDSPNREIYTYDFDETTGNISNRRWER